jgi:hypothetical protein
MAGPLDAQPLANIKRISRFELSEWLHPVSPLQDRTRSSPPIQGINISRENPKHGRPDSSHPSPFRQAFVQDRRVLSASTLAALPHIRTLSWTHPRVGLDAGRREGRDEALAYAVQDVGRRHGPPVLLERQLRAAPHEQSVKSRWSGLRGGFRGRLEKRTHLARVTREPPYAASSSGLPVNSCSVLHLDRTHSLMLDEPVQCFSVAS